MRAQEPGSGINTLQDPAPWALYFCDLYYWHLILFYFPDEILVQR